MAITVHQSPPARALAYNPQKFYASSTQVAQPNFRYKVIITDLITSDTQTYWVDADPDGFCRFDATPFTKTFFTHYLPINTYGWQKSTSIRQIRVNIGEYYGTTPTYYAGSNYDWIAWNGQEDILDFPNFNIDNYLYDITVPNYAYLTDTINSLAFEDRSDYFYVLTKGAGDLVRLRVRTYLPSGALEGEFFIDNPHEASTTYTDKYLCIDVGIKGLTEITGALVTVNAGALPIIKSTTESYIIAEANPSGADPAFRDIKQFTIGCTPRFPVYTIHFLRKNGAFNSFHFHKRSDFTTSKQEQRYSVYPYQADGVSAYEYDRSTIMSRPLNVTSKDVLRLNTDWITPAQVDLLKELFDSPYIYLDEGSTLPYRQVTYIKNSYNLNKAWNEKLFNLQADFEVAATNYRQI